jgi:hypothetical protein
LSAGAFRAVAGEPGILAALLAILLGGLVGSTISLLAPLELHAAGLSKASIGLVFSAAALIFILASAATVKLGERVIHVPDRAGRRARLHAHADARDAERCRRPPSSR